MNKSADMQLLSIPRTAQDSSTRRRRRVRTDVMLMDRQTFRDLEIFEAPGSAPSLYDLLNRTRTTGGGKVLRGRLTRPWSTLEKIREVQSSLQFIIDHRGPFDLIPGEWPVSGVEQYLHCGLALLETNNRFEFFIEALEVRIADRKQYRQIELGVQRATEIVRNIARFASRPQLADPPGELGAIMTEMRSLLASFTRLPEVLPGALSCWQIMRLDRLLRLDERLAFERLLRLVFEIDALVSMADVTYRNGYVIPDVHEGSVEIVADGLYHPFLPRPVPNPIRLDPSERLLFVTGPNMAGKTTYLRACGIAAYLAHLGMGVPAKAYRFAPCDCLFTAISLTDNVREGVSFFRAEALRVKTIARALAEGRRVVGILDEPFMGTNLKDALDASRGVLLRLAEKEGSVFLVSSHLIELGEVLMSTQSVACYRFEASEPSGRLEFDYVLRPGVSSQRLGMRVLREEGVFDLLERTVDPPDS